MNSNVLTKKPRRPFERIEDKVHKQVCGSGSLSEKRLILQKKFIWNDSVWKYVFSVISTCISYHATATLVRNCKISITSPP